MTQGTRPTVDSALRRALEAYAALAELGETIEEEWSYVQDLSTAWRDRLDAVAATRGDDALVATGDAAITAAIAEIDRIEDPHRAIDWLSTFPQVTLLAIGEMP